MNTTLNYPFDLDGTALLGLLPHRGEMLFLRALTVLAHDHYRGIARWDAESGILRGHFPGMPIVPGVLLVEAAAQAAGAGMLAGDPYVRGMEGDRIGVLAGIRKCSFKRPVLPGQDVALELRCRQLSENAASATGSMQVDGQEAAQVEIFLIHSPRALIEQYLGGSLPGGAR